MKKILFLITFLISIFSFSQTDSIVNYLDFNGDKVSKKRAFSVETVVKKGSIWEVVNYYRNGKIKEKGNYKRKDKTLPIGTFYEFFRNGKLKSYFSYDSNSKLTDLTKMWFDNEKISFIGRYKNGKKIGIWKYYHYDGKIATKLYFDKYELAKTLFFDEKGDKISSKLIKFRKPKFEGGGIKKFIKRIKKIHNKIDFQINGKLVVNFTVSVNGEIVDISTSDKIPKELLRKLKIYFKNIKGWEPAIHMNRKVPYEIILPMKFFVNFE